MNIGGHPYQGRGSPSSTSKAAIDNDDNNHHNHHNHHNQNKNAAAAPWEATNSDTVGSLLAAIANAITDTISTLRFADKTHWGPDEFEQLRALDDALDEAKEDFQQLGPLLKGSFYYENDRKRMFNPFSSLGAVFELGPAGLSCLPVGLVEFGS